MLFTRVVAVALMLAMSCSCGQRNVAVLWALLACVVCAENLVQITLLPQCGSLESQTWRRHDGESA